MYVNELVRAVAENISEGEDLPLTALPAVIPYFSVRMSAICVERRELDVLQEFVLRAVGLGFSDELSIGGFLGARSDEVESQLSSLSQEYFVARSTTEQKYSLTEKGITAISQTGLRRVTEREAACYVNGVTRNVEQLSEALVPRRRIPQGSVILPAVPARPPRIGELDVSGVRTAMVMARTPLPRSLEVTRLGRVLRTSSLFLAGHLLLKRGSHSVPVICIHGSPNSDLARILGGHPAVQGIKAAIEADEKRARSFIRNRVPKLLNVKLAPSSDVRAALTRLIGYADAELVALAEGKSQFSKAGQQLLGHTHWISSVEWHVLFATLALEVSQRLLVITPPMSGLLEFGQLECIGNVARRGVDVELVMQEEDAHLVERDERLCAALAGVKVVTIPEIGAACGFCSDGRHLVVGVTRTNVSTMGRYDTFFGAYIADTPNPEEVLLGCAQSSDVAMVTRPKRSEVRERL